jgi:hypothetical protein
MAEALPTFYLLSANYEAGNLTLLMGDGTDRPLVEISFSSPRAFRTYAESDYWRYLNDFEGRPLVVTSDAGSGVEISDNAPYVLDYRATAREQEPEETFSCLVRTPDHCVEVICFEEPAFRYL